MLGCSGSGGAAGSAGGTLGTAVAACAGNPLLLGYVADRLRAGQALPDHAGGPGGSWAARLLLSRFTGVGAAAESYLQALPSDHVWLGLDRWRQRQEAA